MTVRTNSSLSISASLQNGANIGTALITVAKADGSANETIADIKGNATPRVTQSWSISALQYPEGKYIVQLIVTPAGATAPAPSNGTAQTTQVAPPSATGGSATGPSIYYWRGTVKVTSPDKPDGTKTAAASSHVIGSALSKAAVAMGALVLASLVSA
ncbi:hypothetical protein BGW38_003528 [Lunasporangiospora selenospora]|uniref:Uncharacterized protein n=1 Tax=Lunasporangiospora selenospora TaxID=979761 RepID=A0A9P6G170_9FUNG|nr:hypothetical protein BGW38_003528 [Lunasporangiospora selenospora]